LYKNYLIDLLLRYSFIRSFIHSFKDAKALLNMYGAEEAKETQRKFLLKFAEKKLWTPKRICDPSII